MNHSAAPGSGRRRARPIPVPFRSRLSRLTVLAGIIGLLAGVATVSGRPTVTPPIGSAEPLRVMGAFRLLASDASGVTLEYAPAKPVFTDIDTPFGRFQSIAIDGHGPLIELGRPALPTAGVAIAVPEGADARMTWDVLESRTYPGVKPMPSPEGTSDDPAGVQRKNGAAFDASVYEGSEPYPSTSFTFSQLGHLRSHRVGQVAVIPVQFDPKSGSVTVIARARIRVDFAPSRKAAAEPAGRYVPVGEERAWEDTYRSTFLNYDAAKRFRARRLPDFGSELLDGGRSGSPAVIDRPLEAAGPAVTNPEFRIYVGTTGVYYTSYADLAKAGWPANIPLRQVRFYEKSYNAASPRNPLIREIPIKIEEAGTPDSLFNGDDYFYFYGLNFNDRFQPSYADERYTHMHVYWLSWGDTPTRRMDLVPGWYDAPSFTTPLTFANHTHWEQNIRYNYIRPATANDSGQDLPHIDTHYWLDAYASLDSLDFSTPGRDATKPFRLRARWQGVFSNTHYVTIWLTRGQLGVTSDTLLIYRHPFAAEAEYVYDSGFMLPGSRLADGGNRLKLQGNGAGGNIENVGSGAYFNSFDVDYFRGYVASGGFLRFTSADARDNVEFAIRGLADTSAIVFDVTDSLAPAQITGGHFTQVSGPPTRQYEIRFRANIDRQHTYLLYSASAVQPVTKAFPAGKFPADLGTKNIQPDVSVDVTGDDHADADVIVLAHPKFQASLAAWKAKREAPPYNHRVWIVSPQDVWNEFSGGHKSVPAIRTWLRWVYRNRPNPPDYLLLFGDANEDYANDVSTSDEDWVPTMIRYGPVPGSDSRLELIASDNYYVASLDPNDLEWADVFPDMHVGRLSVGSVEEADAVMAKLVAYDNYSPNDAWRNRGLLVSDDRYSTGIGTDSRYQFNGYESDFATGADSLARMFSQTACYTGLDVQQFKLEDVIKEAGCDAGRTYTDGNTPDLISTMDCVLRNVTPRWVQAASQGGLFQIYSGHGNRFVLTTEYLVRYHPEVGSSTDDRTVDQLTNYGKPFIFIGAGCHLNQFAFFLEGLSKAAIAERMVLLPGRGAVASIASSAYEYVSTNLKVEEYLGSSLFSNHPRDPVTGRPRGVLGDAFDQGLVRMANEIGGGPRSNSWFRNCLISYCLLGDPTMQYDMTPPQLQVSVDGAPVDSGAVIKPAPGASTMRITARVSDDVDYRTAADSTGFSIIEHGVAVSPDQFTITPVNDGGQGACRGADISYTATPQPANYPITLTAHDWIGRSMSFTVNVRVSVRYFSNNQEIHSGDKIAVDQPLEVRIESPADLSAGDIQVRLNGEDGHFDMTGSGRTWSATSRNAVPVGQVHLETLIRGQTVGTFSVEGQSATLAMDEIYFYPNPWEGNGPGHFMYQLAYAPGHTPRSARVTVFTVSGRKVVSLDGTVETGRNLIDWDMRDAAGDGLANGVYLFKLVLQTASGQTRTTVDRLVVHR